MAIRPLAFIGDRDPPDPLSAVHARRSILAIELAPVDRVAQEDTMKKISTTERKISTAELKKAILAVEAERLKHPARFRPDRTQRATLRKSRKESEKIMSAFFSKAGLDLKKYRALHEKRSAELERMVAKQKADALKVAARRKDTLYSSIAAQSKALSDVAVQPGFFPNPSFTLDTPFLIWSIPLTDISDSAEVPFGSFAKFKFSSSSSGRAAMLPRAR